MLHCLFCHLEPEKAGQEYWDLACDIAAESVIDSLLRPLCRILLLPDGSFYMRLESRCRVSQCGDTCRTLRDMDSNGSSGWHMPTTTGLQGAGAEASASQPWPETGRGLGSQKREKMQVEMEAFF